MRTGKEPRSIANVSIVAFESAIVDGLKLVCLVISRTAGLAENVDSDDSINEVVCFWPVADILSYAAKGLLRILRP